MSKKNVGVNFGANVGKFSLDEVKSALWQLYYLPESARKWLKPEPADAEVTEIAQAVMAEYQSDGKILLFGQEQPYLSTEGVDLGIKHPIIRDAVLERCYAASEGPVKKRVRCLSKAARLLKTVDAGDEKSMNRIVGGLKEIGFDNKEANYLLDSCNLYPIALLLERLDAKQQTEKTPVPEEKKEQIETVSEEPVNPISSELKEDEELTKAVVSDSFGEMLAGANLLEGNKAFLQAIINNQVEIGLFYNYLQNERSLEEVFEEQEAMQLEANRLRLLKEMAILLGKAGISFETLLEKKKEIAGMITAMTAFVA